MNPEIIKKIEESSNQQMIEAIRNDKALQRILAEKENIFKLAMITVIKKNGSHTYKYKNAFDAEKLNNLEQQLDERLLQIIVSFS